MPNGISIIPGSAIYLRAMIHVRHLLLAALISLALLCVLGPRAINWLESSPITLQSLLVILLPVVVGWRAGTLAIVAYLSLAAAGLPILANYTSGTAAFAGTSAGFLWSFAPIGLLAGL